MTKIDVATLSNMELLQLVESVTVELKDREYHRGLANTSEGVIAAYTPNEQRALLIQRAREFVEEQKDGKGSYRVPDDPFNPFYTRGEFIVNEEKRTVVVLLRGVNSGRVRARGIAKCMPGDVFNEWIGKAIALARALEIEVPQEFLQAVQPTHYSVGQVITFPADDVDYMKMCYRVDSVSSDSELTMLFDDYGKAYGGDLTGSQFDKCEFRNILPIIDDTNAKYEVTL